MASHSHTVSSLVTVPIMTAMPASIPACECSFAQADVYPQIFGFPLFLLVPCAPLSSPVTSVSGVSAFKLTGSPRAEGFVFSFSSAFCFSDLPSSPLLPFAPVSSGVGFVSEVSARKETGSPSCDGFCSFFSFAMSFRDLLSCGRISQSYMLLERAVRTEGAMSGYSRCLC